MRLPSIGILHYGIDPVVGHKVIIEVDQGIVEFYRSLIPKYIILNPQKYAPHISVMRYQVPVNMPAWGLHEGESIPFEYEPVVEHDEKYWWLPAHCERAREIREELGVGKVPWRNAFHITIGNTKPDACKKGEE